MLSYFISGSSSYSLRTKQICDTSSLSWKLTNDFSLSEYTASIVSQSYNSRERLLQFTGSLPSGIQVGDQYTVEILDSGSTVWNGSLQVFKEQNYVKSEYKQQINEEFVSNVTDNDYIILY